MRRSQPTFLLKKVQKVVIAEKSHSVWYVGHISSQESLKNNADIKISEAARKNVQFCLPSSNAKYISDGKLNDHVRDTYPQIINFHIYSLGMLNVVMFFALIYIIFEGAILCNSTIQIEAC